MTSLAVVVVNYNCGDELGRCLDSLCAEMPPDGEVIVVDNGSTDGSVDVVERTFPGVRPLRNGRNLGFAAAVNRGVAASAGELVLLLNPDCLIRPGSLATAVDFMNSNPDVSILGARVLRPDGRLDPPARRSFKTPSTYLYKFTGLAFLFPKSRRFGRYYVSYLDPEQVMDVDAVVGAFMLVRRSAIEEIGPMDERYFMYCEDEDWCWRAKQAGGRVVYHPDVVVDHVKGTTTARQPYRMAYHFHRSLFLYHRKNIAPRYPFAVNVAVYSGIAAGMLTAVLGTTASLISHRISAAASGARP